MELAFKPERITIIKRLKGLTITDIDNRMKESIGSKNSFNLDRWEKLSAKHSIEKVELLARVLEVPVGFFYYNTVDVSMKNNIVEIHIPDTNETLSFKFI